MNAAPHPFTEGLAHEQLRYQCCQACGQPQTLARLACVACGSETLDWRMASGLGTVLAVSVVSRAPSDAFRPLVPYTLVLVGLDEGPRVLGHAVPGTAVGQRVQASTFAHEQRRLLRFGPPR